MDFTTEQEEFWAGQFGSDYISRNQGRNLLASNLNFFSKAFGQTGSEAQACATPVVAFNTTGLKDVVDHKETGYLAQPYEVEDLATGITWCLSDKERLKKLGGQARDRAVKLWSPEVVVPQYLDVYKKAISDWEGDR